MICKLRKRTQRKYSELCWQTLFIYLQNFLEFIIIRKIYEHIIGIPTHLLFYYPSSFVSSWLDTFTFLLLLNKYCVKSMTTLQKRLTFSWVFRWTFQYWSWLGRLVTEIILQGNHVALKWWLCQKLFRCILANGAVSSKAVSLQIEVRLRLWEEERNWYLLFSAF